MIICILTGGILLALQETVVELEEPPDYSAETAEYARDVAYYAAENRPCDSSVYATFMASIMHESSYGCEPHMRQEKCEECFFQITFYPNGNLVSSDKNDHSPMYLLNLHVYQLAYATGMINLRAPITISYHPMDDAPVDTNHSVILHHSIRHGSVCPGVVTVPIHKNLEPNEMQAILDQDHSPNFPRVNYIRSEYFWEAKKPIAIWRGHPNGETRQKLIDLCAQDSMKGLCEATFTIRSWRKMTRHKYIISCAGWSYAGLVHPTLVSGSALIMQQGISHVWYEKYLRPMVHYIPVKNDFSDLRDVILWARQHDEKVRQIANNAQQFASWLFSRQTLICYSAAAYQSAFQLQNLVLLQRNHSSPEP